METGPTTAPAAAVSDRLRRPLIVAITGASGAIYGIRLLQRLRQVRQPAGLIVTAAARRIIELETGEDPARVASHADRVYDEDDIAASVASGSFRTRGMVVAPCSIKTLSAIAHSHADNLVARAADVTLKERRRLVLLVRETPLHLGHLELMAAVTRMGGIVMPPVPAFYLRPATIAELVDQTVVRVADLFDIEFPDVRRWAG